MLDWTKAWEADVVAVNEDVDVNRLLKQQQHHQRYRRFALSPNYPDSAVMLDLIPLLYKIARPQMPRLSPLASSIGMFAGVELRELKMEGILQLTPHF